MRDEQIEKIASQLYSPEMPYHNFGHVYYVLEKSEEIIRKCRQENVPLDESVVYYAVLFHDAGYHEDQTKKGFDTKEAYSAYLAERELQQAGKSKEMIDRVKAAILSTHCDAHCYSNEDKAVRAADLSGLSADYAIFKKNTVNLKKEFEMMSGTRLAWDEWKIMGYERIGLFLKEDMALTSDYFDKDGKSIFIARTQNNLKALMADGVIRT
ncbi:MAG: HD domain-containing protein [Gammaproteobacteria bacterium]|nr:HD domain-containing protein [Gammaproteobacteria bacterium]